MNIEEIKNLNECRNAASDLLRDEFARRTMIIKLIDAASCSEMKEAYARMKAEIEKQEIRPL